MTMINVPELTLAWQQVHVLAHDAVAPIDSEAQYDRAILALEALLSVVGENDQHPLADLIEGLISRVTAFQEVAGHIPPASPDMELRLLMKERGITQKALSEATGIAQGQISRLASGRRAFTTDHVRRLAGYFKVAPGVFIGISG